LLTFRVNKVTHVNTIALLQLQILIKINVEKEKAQPRSMTHWGKLSEALFIDDSNPLKFLDRDNFMSSRRIY